MRMNLKSMKWIAMGLIVVLVTPLFLIVTARSEPETIRDVPGDIRQTAADISNMTGVPIERILELKRSGLDWNGVLDKVKTLEGGSSADKKDRMSALTGSGIGEELMEALIREGFAKERILEAKMIVERVQFQLADITRSLPTDTEAPKPTVLLNSRESNSSADFQQVADRFDPAQAIRYVLRLEADLGSLEAGLDEYLFALQAELDLEDYWKDRDAYKRSKEEKRFLIQHERIVTMSSIEQAMLDKVAGANKKESVGESILPQANKTLTESDTNLGLPDVPAAPRPSVKDVKPTNPADQIKNELQAINPNK